MLYEAPQWLSDSGLVVSRAQPDDVLDSKSNACCLQQLVFLSFGPVLMGSCSAGCLCSFTLQVLQQLLGSAICRYLQQQQ